MANIFNLENFADFSEKINIDELYEKKRLSDVNKLELFKKILNRIHIRIKTTARQNVIDRSCWFVVPEIIIGVPKYDQGDCIGYLFQKLKDNGFAVQYYHPNTLFISWNHFVPSYVRTEIKKKTGLVIDQNGKKVDASDSGSNGDIKTITAEPSNPNDYMFNQSGKVGDTNGKPKKEYTPIKSYRPSGNLIYDDDLLNKIEDKFL
jgi:hypothetical protein